MPTPPAAPPPASSPRPRPVAQIRAQIADVQRYLADVPPHSGGGTRTELQARLERLQRELAAAERGRP